MTQYTLSEDARSFIAYSLLTAADKYAECAIECGATENLVTARLQLERQDAQARHMAEIIKIADSVAVFGDEAGVWLQEWKS